MAASEPRVNRRRWPVQALTLAACLLSWASSGCLQLNADYSYPVEGQDPREESSSTSSENVNPSTLATAATATQEDSAPAQNPTSTGSGTSPNSQNNTSSTDSSSTSEEPSPSEPGPGSRWIPFTVRNPASNGSVQPGNSASLTLDHAALVAGGAQSNGDDLRIYTIRGGIKTQLHRVLDPESAWGRSDTKLWFNLDSALTESQTETGIYHLVLDANTNKPAQDPQQVFLVYDDFNSPNPELDGWTVDQVGSFGSVDSEISGGQLRLSAQASSNETVRTILRSNRTISVSSLAMEASVSWDSGAPYGCTEETLLGLWSPATFDKRAVWNRRDNDWYLAYERNGGSEFHDAVSASPVDGNMRRHLAYWADGNVSLYTSQGFAGVVRPRLTSFLNPSDGPLLIGFGAGADGAICSNTSRLRVDWVLARMVSGVFEIETALQYAQEFVLP